MIYRRLNIGLFIVTHRRDKRIPAHIKRRGVSVPYTNYCLLYSRWVKPLWYLFNLFAVWLYWLILSLGGGLTEWQHAAGTWLTYTGTVLILWNTSKLIVRLRQGYYE